MKDRRVELTAGLKPATHGVQIRCSIHLELRQHFKVRAGIEPTYHLYERCVLPLNQRTVSCGCVSSRVIHPTKFHEIGISEIPRRQSLGFS